MINEDISIMINEDISIMINEDISVMTNELSLSLIILPPALLAELFLRLS